MNRPDNMAVNPKQLYERNGLCKPRFTSARASMQFHRFKPGLSHPQPGLNEVVSGTQGPSWLRPGLNFFHLVPSAPNPESGSNPPRQLADWRV